MTAVRGSALAFEPLENRPANPGRAWHVTAELVDRFDQLGRDGQVQVGHRHGLQHTRMYKNVLDRGVQPCIIMYMNKAATTQEQQMNYRGESFHIGQTVTRINFDGDVEGGEFIVTSDVFHSVSYRTLSVMVTESGRSYITPQAIAIDSLTALQVTA